MLCYVILYIDTFEPGRCPAWGRPPCWQSSRASASIQAMCSFEDDVLNMNTTYNIYTYIYIHDSCID